ncbi:MAG: sulfurtransferase [Betaproteobacteria bacterium]|nr:sulfurtransferase [Betaproteobacteria bacterium]
MMSPAAPIKLQMPIPRRAPRALQVLIGCLVVAAALCSHPVMAQTPPAAAAASAEVVSPIITPAALKALIDKKANLRILDIRELMQGDGKTPNYDAGHIPGAIAAPYSSIRGPEKNPGRVPSDQELTQLFRKWEIDAQAHIIIAPVGSDASDFGGAARLFWTLRLAGLKRISILEGGLGAWGALGYPIETTKNTPAASSISVKLDRTQIATTSEIAGLIRNRTSGKKFLLSDSRPEDYFLGEDKHPASPRAGTLPGAKNHDHEEWFQLNTSKLLPRDQLESIAKNAGLIGDQDVITFCNTGHWSATTWFVLTQLLGQSNIKLYPESTVSWSKSRNPMDNEPSRATVLKQQLKDSVDNLKR